MKESDAQRPVARTTSKGVPLSRYSSVAPTQMLWPFKGVSHALSAARLSVLSRRDLVSGEWPEAVRKAKREPCLGGLLTMRWLRKASSGSAGPSRTPRRQTLRVEPSLCAEGGTRARGYRVHQSQCGKKKICWGSVLERIESCAGRDSKLPHSSASPERCRQACEYGSGKGLVRSRVSRMREM